MLSRKASRCFVAGLAAATYFALGAPGAHAASLDQAKSQGMVCELPTGYLKATGSATGDVQALVKEINAGRKAEYSRIANEHGVTPEQVGKLTARKLQPKCR